MDVKKKKQKRQQKPWNSKLPPAISDVTVGTILPEYESPAM